MTGFTKHNENIEIGGSLRSKGSTVETNGNSFAFGLNVVASGIYSHAEGSGTTASGNYSHAEGQNTTASGITSHAEGYNTLAGGNYSHSEGYGTTASGSYSHSQGFNTLASGNYSHAGGQSTTASGTLSRAEGTGTKATGIGSFSSGYFTNANGTYSFVHGSASTASGVATIVLGSGLTGTSNNTVYVNTLNVSDNVVIGTTSANTSSILDLTSTSKGFLPPRMNGNQAESITSPATGLMIYSISGNGTTITSTGLWQYNGTKWINVDDRVPSKQSVVSSATVTPTVTDEFITVTALATDMTLANPTGTWSDGQDLIVRVKDNGTSRLINYGGNYRAVGVTLPVNTVPNKTLYLGIIYNSADNRFDIIGVNQE